MTLADSVENSAFVVAEYATGLDFVNFTRGEINIFSKKIFHADFPDETDAHGLFLVGIMETFSRGELFYFRF